MDTIDLISPQPPRKPPWLKVQLPRGDAYETVKSERGQLTARRDDAAIRSR